MLLKRVLPAAGVAVCVLALTACGKPVAPAAPGAAATAPAAAAPAAPTAATPAPTAVTPTPAPAVAPGPVAAAPAAVAPMAAMREGRRGMRGGMGGGGKGGGGGRRAMLLQACAADIAKFCPGSDKPGKCLKPHKAELSASCQAARAQMKAARQARMNRNGGGDDE